MDQLAGQVILVLGGSSGIGLETARRARSEGADLILTAREPNRLHRIGLELGASISAFDLTDTGRLVRFFANLPALVDHVLVSGGRPQYSSFAELDVGKIRRGVDRILLSVQIARLAKDAMKPTGSLVLLGGIGDLCAPAGPLTSTVATAMPALARSLALELAPVRVNVITSGLLGRPLSAPLLGERLDERDDQLRGSLPSGGRVRPEDVAALAIDLMTNTAVTGEMFDIDGGQGVVDR